MSSVTPMSPPSDDESSDVHLCCLGCGAEFELGMNVRCPACGPEAFLRSEYRRRSFEPNGDPSAFKSYDDWLPFDVDPLPDLHLGTTSSPRLAEAFGLGQLWFAVSGYVPELGADLPTCTFKALEAVGVMQRVAEQSDRTLILPSAGNAGAAVLEFGRCWDRPAVVIVPEDALPAMLSTVPPRPRSPLLVALRDAAYPDAIAMVKRMVEVFPKALAREGGAFNVARRDAMGVPVLRTIHAMGRRPDHYFQAVGSGTGGIAAHEAALRLAAAGVSGERMRLHLAQNIPFTPLVDAWSADADAVPSMTRDEVHARLADTITDVLANATPPWAVAGGVRDVLRQSGGEMVGVSNDQIRRGCADLESELGFEPFPEAGAAFAALRSAAERGELRAGETALVHVTGAGWHRSIKDLERCDHGPDHVCSLDDADGVARAIGAYLERVAA